MLFTIPIFKLTSITVAVVLTCLAKMKAKMGQPFI